MQAYFRFHVNFVTLLSHYTTVTQSILQTHISQEFETEVKSDSVQ